MTIFFVFLVVGEFAPVVFRHDVDFEIFRGIYLLKDIVVSLLWYNTILLEPQLLKNCGVYDEGNHVCILNLPEKEKNH